MKNCVPEKAFKKTWHFPAVILKRLKVAFLARGEEKKNYKFCLNNFLNKYKSCNYIKSFNFHYVTVNKF